MTSLRVVKRKRKKIKNKAEISKRNISRKKTENDKLYNIVTYTEKIFVILSQKLVINESQMHKKTSGKSKTIKSREN